MLANCNGLLDLDYDISLTNPGGFFQRQFGADQAGVFEVDINPADSPNRPDCFCSHLLRSSFFSLSPALFTPPSGSNASMNK
jgi:hypothetical protein